MRKLIYMLFFVSVFSYAQQDLLLASQQQFANEGGGTSMSDFGTLVSDMVVDDMAETAQDATVSTWYDSYGSNDATSLNSALTTIDIVSGDKQIFLDRGVFNFGKPASLDFVPTVNSFTFVIQLGDFTADASNRTLISKAGNTSGSRQYQFYIDDEERLFAYLGGDPYNSYEFTVSANDILQIVYDTSVGAQGTLYYYLNGVLEDSFTIATANTSSQNYNVNIGARNDIQDIFLGNMKRVSIFSNPIDATNLASMTTYLNSL